MPFKKNNSFWIFLKGPVVISTRTAELLYDRKYIF